jgi:hypothetical protein
MSIDADEFRPDPGPSSPSHSTDCSSVLNVGISSMSLTSRHTRIGVAAIMVDTSVPGEGTSRD